MNTRFLTIQRRLRCTACHTRTNHFGIEIWETVRRYNILDTQCIHSVFGISSRACLSCFAGLDYTNNFQGNKSPDEFLYNFLADLYGTTDGLPRANSTTSTGTTDNTDTDTTTTDTSNTDGDTATDEATTGDGSRIRRSLQRRRTLSSSSRRHLFASVEDKARRRHLLDRWNDINALVLQPMALDALERVHGGRRLHQSEHGASHEIVLDETYTVQIHLLLA
jgi:hypothetical protein